MTIEIEKNIPLPSQAERNAARKRKYPYMEMEVGDSFYVDDMYYTSARSIVCRYARESGRKFTTAPEPGRNGHRIWRIA